MLKRARFVVWPAVAATALALYRPAASAWFYQDDLQWLAGTLTFEPGSLLDLSGHQHFYRPVISLYFWALTPLVNGSPVLFHWANNLLHAVNGLLVLLLSLTLGFRLPFAFLAAVFFVSMPAHIEATAWVSALAEPVTTFFGLPAVYAVLRSRRNGNAAWMWLAVVCFGLALMTHESAVVLLPLMIIADIALAKPDRERDLLRREVWITRARRFLPFVVLLLGYLVVDLTVNSRSYLVEEGHYRIGFHAVENLLAYVVTLYVGERNLPSFISVAVVLLLLLVRGTPRVVFATAWLLLSILPFAFFTWSNTSRYAYMPAVGMAWLLAEALEWLDRWLARVAPGGTRIVTVTALGAFLAVRFMLFAAENIENFTVRTERYRQFAATIRQEHPDPPPGARLPVDARTADELQFRYLEALAQWEFRDPAITLVVRPGP